MKFLVLLFALVVCANAQRPLSIVVNKEIVEKIEMQSTSATIVTELLETTFHFPAELTKEIGYIFRILPVSLAKETVAFILRVFDDLNSNHLESFSQNAAQVTHIFGQVWEHIDVNEVIALVTSEILPPLWTEIIVKLGATFGLFVKVFFLSYFKYGFLIFI